MADALDCFQSRRLDSAELGRIAAVVLSTDGFNKSFRNDTVAAAQIRAMTERLAWDASAAVSRELENWLQRVTEAGSGDDISLIVGARQGHKG